jgi:hypothetical protein
VLAVWIFSTAIGNRRLPGLLPADNKCSGRLMTGSQGALPLEQADTASEPKTLGVFIPLVEHVQLFVGRRREVLHAGDHLGGTSTTGTIKTTGLQFDSGQLAGLDEQLSIGDFGRLLGGKNSDRGHGVLKKDGRSNSGARAEVNLGRFPMRQTGPNFSGENPPDHLAVDIGQTSLDAVVVEGEFFVIDAQKVEKGRVKIRNGHSILAHRITDLIGRSIPVPRPDSRSG